jgi:hypothetical protein
MTDAQAAHEASKIIISGVVLCVGVHYEQAVYTLISAMPMLEPIGEILSIAVVGGLSALTSSILVYAIDKIDAFQVMDVQRHHDVMNQLEKQIEELNKDSEELIEKMVTYV